MWNLERGKLPRSRPRGAPAGKPLRPSPRPLLRSRPRFRRSGAVLWDGPPAVVAATTCPTPRVDLDDPQALRALQEAFNQLFDELVRRARSR